MAGPLAGVRCVGRPDTNGLILRGRGDVRLGEDARRPGDIADPIGVAFQCLGGVVGLALVATNVRLDVSKCPLVQ